MKFYKRMASVALAFAIAASFTACGSSTPNAGTTTKPADTTTTADNTTAAADTEVDGNADTWIADRTITMQAYVDDIGYSLPDDQANTLVMQEIKNRTGINLEIRYTPGEEDVKVMASQMAAGNIPDMIVSYLDDSTRPEFPILLKAAKDGMFADLSSYIPDSNVYSHYLQDGYLPNDARKNIMFRDDFGGAVYLMSLGVDRVDNSLVFDPEVNLIGGMYIQKAIAEDLGIDPREIVTQEQLYDLLVNIKNGGYTDDNGNPVWPLGPKYWGGSVDALKNVVRGYDWSENDFYNLDSNGNVMHEAETDFVFDKINYMRKLLAEGLMNPEFFTMDSTRAEEVSKSHNSAIMSDCHNYMQIIYETDEWLPLGPLNDYTGTNATITGGKAATHVWAISADADNPQEIFQFMDYLTSYEGKLLSNYGIEGDSYTIESGKPALTQEIMDMLAADDKDTLINHYGAAFGDRAMIGMSFFYTDKAAKADFGEERPGAGNMSEFVKAVEIGNYAPSTFRLVEGLRATAYLSDESMTDVKAQLGLLNYREMLTQAIYASSDAEVESIVNTFREQLKAAGNDDFKAFVKEKYDEDPKAVRFY